MPINILNQDTESLGSIMHIMAQWVAKVKFIFCYNQHNDSDVYPSVTQAPNQNWHSVSTMTARIFGEDSFWSFQDSRNSLI
jgi:hypothetical protein